MAWYWWIVVAIVAVMAVRAMRAAPKNEQSAGSDEFAFLEKHRQRRADAERELAKVVEVIAALPVVESTHPVGNTLTRLQLPGAVENFLESKFMLQSQTATKMIHVVLSPVKITVFAKLKPTEPAAAMRIFSRTGDDSWVFETRSVDEMQSAIARAEQEAENSGG